MKTALFVTNRAGPEFDPKLKVVEDFLGAKLSGMGLGLITRDLIIGSVADYDAETVSAVRDPARLEAQLRDATSAKRLAENMGADYILMASITSFGERKKAVAAYGVDYTNYIYTLRLTYRLIDGAGVSLLGDTVKSTQTEQNTIYSNEGMVGQMAPAELDLVGNGSLAVASDADEGLVNVVRKYQSAVGLVVTTNRGEPEGMATAWAIAPSVFATNAHVSQPIGELLQKGGSAYIVLNKSPDRRFRITEAITHPRYLRAGKSFEGRDPAAAPYDVGILKIDGRTDVWFPIANRSELTQLDSGYRIAYLGFPMEGLSGNGVDPRNPVATMQSGIVTSNTDWWQGAGEFENRFLVQHNLGAVGGASGSPIFNPQGEVVALLNAGNIVVTLQYDDNGKPFVARTPSAALINFGQRVDLLSDIYSSSGQGVANVASAPAKSAPGSNTGYRAVFADPDVSAFIDDLLDDATSKVAVSMETKLASTQIPAPVETPENVTIRIDVETADLYIPDVRLGPESTVSILDGELKVAPLDVTVEVDGTAVGKAPGSITLKPGFSRLRLTREGYEPWERMINAVDGQTLQVAMQMDEQGLRRWKELTLFAHELKNDAKLTDAQIQLIEGLAQMLEQSGLRIDFGGAQSLEKYKSLFL